jgi:hypothetical protein
VGCIGPTSSCLRPPADRRWGHALTGSGRLTVALRGIVDIVGACRVASHRRHARPEQIADNGTNGMGHAPDEDDMERRDPEQKTSSLTCLACNECVPLDPERMRLTVTHAVVCCPVCGAETPARRADAYRGAADAVAWGFAIYAGQAPEAAPTVGPEPRVVEGESPPTNAARLRRPPGVHARSGRLWRRAARAWSSWPAHEGVASRVPSFFGAACLPSQPRHG